MARERKIYAIEFTVIILLWTLVFISPLLFIDDVNQNWYAVYVMWAEYSVVGFAFIINRLLLIPLLFSTKRYIGYICSLLLLFILLSLFVLHLDGVNVVLDLFTDVRHAPEMFSMPPQRPPHGAMPPAHIASTVIPPMFSVLILAAITIALDLGIRVAGAWVISEQKRAEIDRERIMAQLLNLQSQVSPHFFMNTLNNIHALVDIDSKRAKSTIIELSNLMSYLLYDCSNKRSVPLQLELDFISNYISLMQLRFPKDVEIYFCYDDDVPAVNIPPLLFLNFIENAFKYGVDYDSESLIKIDFKFSDRYIVMSTLNSNHSSTAKTQRHGLGIANSRKRLDMIYGEGYTLDISERERLYYVNLKIPIR
ncbi:MAG: sensor histidine kinase [Rikenellaceae bacterium]